MFPVHKREDSASKRFKKRIYAVRIEGHDDIKPEDGEEFVMVEGVTDGTIKGELEIGCRVVDPIKQERDQSINTPVFELKIPSEKLSQVPSDIIREKITETVQAYETDYYSPEEIELEIKKELGENFKDEELKVFPKPNIAFLDEDDRKSWEEEQRQAYKQKRQAKIDAISKKIGSVKSYRAVNNPTDIVKLTLTKPFELDGLKAQFKELEVSSIKKNQVKGYKGKQCVGTYYVYMNISNATHKGEIIKDGSIRAILKEGEFDEADFTTDICYAKKTFPKFVEERNTEEKIITIKPDTIMQTIFNDDGSKEIVKDPVMCNFKINLNGEDPILLENTKFKLFFDYKRQKTMRKRVDNKMVETKVPMTVEENMERLRKKVGILKGTRKRSKTKIDQIIDIDELLGESNKPEKIIDKKLDI